MLSSLLPPLRIAIPNKGRLRHALEPTLVRFDVLPRSNHQTRSLVFNVPSPRLGNLEIVCARAADIASLIANGMVDAGITGSDLVAESGLQIEPVLDLGLARCRLVLAAPALAPPRDKPGMWRVATSFPQLARTYFAERGQCVSILQISGAVEAMPRLGAADMIVDLVGTGATLRANALVEVATLLNASATLYARNPRCGRVRAVAEALREPAPAPLATDAVPL